MIEWQYRKLALNDVPRKSSEVQLLCQAGEEGWELVVILDNNLAYLKRPLDDQVMDEATDPASHGQNEDSGGNPSSAPKAHEVKPKYRDPKTGETWSGRGEPQLRPWLPLSSLAAWSCAEVANDGFARGNGAHPP